MNDAKWVVISKSGCDFCNKAKLLLEKNNIMYDEVRVSSPEMKADVVKEIGEFATYPQVIKYEDGFPTLIGGYTELEESFSLYNNHNMMYSEETIEVKDIDDLSVLEG